MTGGPTRIQVTVFTDEGDELELDLPAKFALCPRCRGAGSHVNPAIDGNGLTREDLDEAGPEFFEDYMAGVYDVACHRCKGEKVIKELDRDRADPDDLALYDKTMKELADLEAEEAAERRFGC